jgi:hypothetical protein
MVVTTLAGKMVPQAAAGVPTSATLTESPAKTPLGPVTVAVIADVEVPLFRTMFGVAFSATVLVGDVGGPKYPKASIKRLIVAPFLGPL